MTTPFIYRIIDQPKWVLIETKDGFVVTDQTPEVPDDRNKSLAIHRFEYGSAERDEGWKAPSLFR